jgi:hypothetical protein
MRNQWIVMAFLVATLSACCPIMKTQTPGPLPPPVSMSDQVQMLNDHARALPRLQAKGSVVLRYIDDEGKPHQDSADGFLLLRQRYEVEGASDPADAYLRGTFAGQEIFSAAKNQQKWWFIRKDIKTGWVGDVEGTPDFSGTHSGGVMRADLMLQVLAITEIQPHPGEVAAMKVHDSTRSNELEILCLRSSNTAWVMREIIVDRDTGDVRQVTLGDPAGRLAVRADLKNYQPVTYKEGAEVPAPGGAILPKFPRDITIDYPSQKLNIHFTVESAELLPSVPERPFETPDFQELGIKKMENSQ